MGWTGKMPSKIEYATTFADRRTEMHSDSTGTYTRHLTESELTPQPPVGSGWAMCGAAVTESMIFWFWCRKVKSLT